MLLLTILAALSTVLPQHQVQPVPRISADDTAALTGYFLERSPVVVQNSSSQYLRRILLLCTDQHCIRTCCWA